LRLAECLERTPVDQLKRILQTVAPDLEIPESTRTEEWLAERLLDRGVLERLLEGLSDEEWAALKVVFFNGGDQGITVELCHQIVNLLSGRRRKSPARAVEDLKNRGLIYPRTQNYRQVFFIPTDLMLVLESILHRQMIHRVCLTPAETVRPAPPERDLPEDVHRFLAYIYKNEITLTQQGQVFKRHMRALLELLDMDVDDEESLVGRYPEPLGLLVGYALDRRLIVREEGMLLDRLSVHPFPELLQELFKLGGRLPLRAAGPVEDHRNRFLQRRMGAQPAQEAQRIQRPQGAVQVPSQQRLHKVGDPLPVGRRNRSHHPEVDEN
jgi:hypothetical protein